MSRLLALAALFALAFGVFASASIYAAPLAAYEAVAGDVCIVAGDAVPVHTAGKLCAKRHSLGVPCSPQPAVLPPAGPCLVADVADHILPPLLTMQSSADFGRVFRPPRPLVA